jgi:hypothetical protein
MNKILVYSNQVTPRLNYIVDFILRDLCGSMPFITSSPEEFKQSPIPKINYSDTRFGSEFQVIPQGLLFEKGLRPLEITDCNPDQNFAFFYTEEHGSFPFDLFSASFYLLSRYEEYLPFEADAHGRFEAGSSFALKKKFIDIPVIEHWAWMMAAWLERLYPSFQLSRPFFECQTTIDVDNAYYALHKGTIRSCASLAKALLQGRYSEFSNKWEIITGRVADPFDQYDYIFELYRSFGISCRFFFLLAPGGKFDRSLNPRNKAFRRLILYINQTFPVGIHLSYQSHLDARRIAYEISLLQQITGKQVNTNRQHYLKLSLPHSYKELIKAGITDDYSMGYASHTGFRAGTSRSFYFYDLSTESPTNLRVHPFVVMDQTLRSYMQLGIEEANKHIAKLIKNTREVNGRFICLWHNESLGNEGQWFNWQEVYVKMLTALKQNLGEGI